MHGRVNIWGPWLDCDFVLMLCCFWNTFFKCIISADYMTDLYPLYLISSTLYQLQVIQAHPIQFSFFWSFLFSIRSLSFRTNQFSHHLYHHYFCPNDRLNPSSSLMSFVQSVSLLARHQIPLYLALACFSLSLPPPPFLCIANSGSAPGR